MTNDRTIWTETFIHLFALASRLEGEGQYNLAKLARAVADSLRRQERYPVNISTDKDKLAADIQQTVDGLSSLNVNADLLSALKQSCRSMRR